MLSASVNRRTASACLTVFMLSTRRQSVARSIETIPHNGWCALRINHMEIRIRATSPVPVPEYALIRSGKSAHSPLYARPSIDSFLFGLRLCSTPPTVCTYASWPVQHPYLTCRISGDTSSILGWKVDQKRGTMIPGRVFLSLLVGWRGVSRHYRGPRNCINRLQIVGVRLSILT